MVVSEKTLRKSGRWTSFITRQVRVMRRELVAELGADPIGRKRFYLESFLKKFGIFLVLSRELKTCTVINDSGDLIGMLDKNFLAWQHSLSRDLSLLFGDSPAKDDLERMFK